ncbi:RES family NAD+ phosphorylase [Thioclava sp.]|uniref:RES family NAD+ phosphorylase n=1 Tax=Thioclava sp. TaxID=1933450 RepID=UPI003241D198
MIPFHGTVWRILSADRADEACEPARHPEGRFHYSGQVALYASLSAEGAAVALRRYVRTADPPRVIVPLEIMTEAMDDLRGTPDQAQASVVWQDDRERGAPSPTWRLSDRTRGALGLIYASRSRPDLSHLVLFAVSPSTIRQAGPAQPWHPPYPIPSA